MTARRMLAVLIFCVLSFPGCSQKASTVDARDAKDIVTSLTYVKDARSKQCFAVVASRHVAEFQQNGFTITWVPCTPEVEALIKQ
jgi:hypothetical protein